MYYNKIEVILRDERDVVNSHQRPIWKEAVVNRAYGGEDDGDTPDCREFDGQTPACMLNPFHLICS